MPSFITHLFLTEQLHKRYFPNINRHDLLIGSVFPDIRKLNILNRSDTHFDYITREQVYSTGSAFHLGVLLHNIVDLMFMQHKLRMIYIRKLSKDFGHWYSAYNAMTFYLDKFYLENFNIDINVYVNLLEFVPKDAVDYHNNLNDTHIKNWHKKIQYYLKHSPKSPREIEDNLREWKHPKKETKIILKIFKAINNNASITSDIEDFTEYVYNSLKEFTEWQTTTQPIKTANLNLQKPLHKA